MRSRLPLARSGVAIIRLRHPRGRYFPISHLPRSPTTSAIHFPIQRLPSCLGGFLGIPLFRHTLERRGIVETFKPRRRLVLSHFVSTLRLMIHIPQHWVNTPLQFNIFHYLFCLCRCSVISSHPRLLSYTGGWNSSSKPAQFTHGLETYM